MEITRRAFVSSTVAAAAIMALPVVVAVTAHEARIDEHVTYVDGEVTYSYTFTNEAGVTHSLWSHGNRVMDWMI